MDAASANSIFSGKAAFGSFPGTLKGLAQMCQSFLLYLTKPITANGGSSQNTHPTERFRAKVRAEQEIQACLHADGKK